MISEEGEPTQKKKTFPEPPSSFSSLPHEITENILARVSRWNYPCLSLVCKSFRSLLSSMEIYKTRSQIGVNETCVYICLELPGQRCESWFSPWTKYNKKRTERIGAKTRFKGDSSGNSVVPTPFSSSHTPPLPCDYIQTVGSEIYLIGGPYREPSSSVRILDCKSHTWLDDYRDIVNVYDGKIYLATDEKDYTYDPKDGTWKLVRENTSFIPDSVECWCDEMENVIYCCTDSGYLMWSTSEIEGREWREIKGLDKLREHLKTGNDFVMANYGGKLLVMWHSYPDFCIRDKIWYAKICLESRCNGREVWGKVECVDMLTFPVETYESFCCLTTSV
ncbi:unnamed protein product [Brassica rapa subsp. narinosa]